MINYTWFWVEKDIYSFISQAYSATLFIPWVGERVALELYILYIESRKLELAVHLRVEGDSPESGKLILLCVVCSSTFVIVYIKRKRERDREKEWEFLTPGNKSLIHYYYYYCWFLLVPVMKWKKCPFLIAPRLRACEKHQEHDKRI